MKKKRESQGQGSFAIGEHLALSVILAEIAERHAPDSPMRKRLEAWAKENIPSVLKEGNSSGDVLGVFKKYAAYLETLLSQMEAKRDLGERVTGIEQNKKAIKAAVAAGNVKRALEKKVFHLLKWKRYRELQHPDIARLIELARKTGDQKLFIRLGRALQKRAQVQGPKDLQVEKLSFVLVEWWLKRPDGGIGLCRLTDEALTDFCNLALGRTDLTLDKVRKMRYRLGLKKGRRPWFTKVEKTKEGIINP